jgi:hypothetical protein
MNVLRESHKNFGNSKPRLGDSVSIVAFCNFSDFLKTINNENIPSVQAITSDPEKVFEFNLSTFVKKTMVLFVKVLTGIGIGSGIGAAVALASPLIMSIAYFVAHCLGFTVVGVASGSIAAAIQTPITAAGSAFSRKTHHAEGHVDHIMLRDLLTILPALSLRATRVYHLLCCSFCCGGISQKQPKSSA